MKGELASASKWILHCRSQHEEINLVSEEEFYDTAPEAISKPVGR